MGTSERGFGDRYHDRYHDYEIAPGEHQQESKEKYRNGMLGTVVIVNRPCRRHETPSPPYTSHHDCAAKSLDIIVITIVFTIILVTVPLLTNRLLPLMRLFAGLDL